MRILILIRMALLLLGAISSTLLAAADTTNGDGPDEAFFFHCSQGEVEDLQRVFKTNPEWVHARTPEGETCLHLTGIYGYSKVTALLLETGADPNVRTTFEQGLRMTPLSWNVYGNHYDNAKLLLEAGAKVNADFDLMVETVAQKVTALDIVRMINGDGQDEELKKMEALLLQYGAKTMKEVEGSEL